ncbi:hypothetical protein CEQ90_15710 [Lewinellaceae bacterium SD302]|nr:hypothetical protein CEQ90_15710 [Lewinellaceae bacterium SD302]
MPKFFLFVLTCLIYLPAFAQTYFDTLQTRLAAIEARNELPGFGVAIVNGTGILYENGFGYADLRAKASYTEHTVQNVGSVSKTLIGIALQQLVDEGLLNWDDSINEHLDFRVVHPRFPEQPILLKHLASHTAGINDGKYYDAAYSLLEPERYTLKELKAIGTETPKMRKSKSMTIGEYCRRFFLKDGAFYRKNNFTKYPPGERYVYSNVGAALAGYVLERVTGQSFADYTRARILKPLGMNNSGWSYDVIDPETIGEIYGKSRLALPHYTLATYPDGGLLTSVHQLGLYLSASIRGKREGNEILSREGYRELMEPVVQSDKGGDRYGYFWETMSSGFSGHSGGDPGIVTLMYVDPKTELGAIAFFNSSAAKKNAYAEVFRELIRAARKINR